MASCVDYLGLWPADQQPIAYGVGMAESGMRLDAECLNCAGVAEDSVCCWQVNLNAHPQYDRDQLKHDPAACAHAALDVWEGSGWDAWSTYRNGRYLAFLGQAPGAVGPPGGGRAGENVQTSAQPAPRVSPWLVLGGVALALWAAGV